MILWFFRFTDDQKNRKQQHKLNHINSNQKWTETETENETNLAQQIILNGLKCYHVVVFVVVVAVGVVIVVDVAVIVVDEDVVEVVAVYCCPLYAICCFVLLFHFVFFI